MNLDNEKQIMMIIVNAGDAKSKAFEAIGRAKDGEFEKAKQLLKEGNSTMTLAHHQHTELLQSSFDKPETAISMLMAHAQDHLMSASIVLDLAREICVLHQMLHDKLSDKEGSQNEDFIGMCCRDKQ